MRKTYGKSKERKKDDEHKTKQTKTQAEET